MPQTLPGVDLLGVIKEMISTKKTLQAESEMA